MDFENFNLESKLKNLSGELKKMANNFLNYSPKYSNEANSKTFNVTLKAPTNLKIDNVIGQCSISPSQNNNLILDVQYSYNKKSGDIFNLIHESNNFYLKLDDNTFITKIDIFLPQNFINDIQINTLNSSSIIINDMSLNSFNIKSDICNLVINNTEFESLNIKSENLIYYSSDTTANQLRISTEDCSFSETKSNFKKLNIISKDGSINYQINDFFYKFMQHKITLGNGTINVRVKGKLVFYKTFSLYMGNGLMNIKLGNLKIKNNGHFQKTLYDPYTGTHTKKLNMDFSSKSGSIIIK